MAAWAANAWRVASPVAEMAWATSAASPSAVASAESPTTGRAGGAPGTGIPPLFPVFLDLRGRDVADTWYQVRKKLGDLKAKGILTEEEFSAKKAELLKKLV